MCYAAQLGPVRLWRTCYVAPGIVLVTLVVPDYDEALDFYVRTPGFQLLEDTPLAGSKRWVVVAPPGNRGTALQLALAECDRQQDRVGDQTGGRVATEPYGNRWDLLQSAD